MTTILVGGAGGAPSNNFIRSLRESGTPYTIVGMSSRATDLFLADAEDKYVVPRAVDPEYPETLLAIVEKVRPQLIHSQNDFEVRAISRLRDELQARGVTVFFPQAETIEICVDKNRSYEKWAAAGVPVPSTMLITDRASLQRAFDQYGPTVWLRAIEGGGGAGAVPTDNIEFARLWIDRFEGWGHFTASELLTSDSVTWSSIWHEGELMVAQTRKRLSWNFGNRTLSGVTGITGVAQTCADEAITSLSLAAINAVDTRPHGIFSVDMTYDSARRARVTEINIGRFFTTHYFFTCAGLNMPEIYCQLALSGRKPALERAINPLPEDLLWIRGMDVPPVMTTLDDLERLASKRP